MSRIAEAWQKLQFPWDMEGVVPPDRSYLRDIGTKHAFAEQPGNNNISSRKFKLYIIRRLKKYLENPPIISSGKSGKFKIVIF